MAFIKKKTLVYYDKRIENVRQRKLELKRELEKADEEEKSLECQRRDFGMGKYGTKKVRSRIISEADYYHYSQCEIEKLKKYMDLDWNQDNVTNEVIDDFSDAEEYIKSQTPYRRNPFYKIGDMLEDDTDES